MNIGVLLVTILQVLNNEDVVNLDRVNKLLDQASNKRLGPVFDKFAVTSVERCSQVWTTFCDIWTNQNTSIDIWTNPCEILTNHRNIWTNPF